MAGSREKAAVALVVVVSALVAIVSARPYAGSWNDGSRLAMVESLVDQGTLAIDDSIFVKVPSPSNAAQQSPYQGVALENGTLDKLFIAGHFYSDKSPVPGLLLAAMYQLLQWLFGLNVRVDPHLFCWSMTVLSSGIAYVVACVCIFRFAGLVGNTLLWRLLLTASFAFATVAVVYVQHVNNHILLLGVAAALMLQAAKLLLSPKTTNERRGSSPPDEPNGPCDLPWRLSLLGCLAGLAYTIDLGAGPPLLAASGLLVAWQCSLRIQSLTWFAIGAIPWLALHHAVNYSVGGTFGPANAVPAYLSWDGCPFQGAAMTGTWHHTSVFAFAVYAMDLLFGKRGFIGHNLGLFLVVGVLALGCRRWWDHFRFLIFDFRFGTNGDSSSSDRDGELSEQIKNQKSKIKNLVLFSAFWATATWLAYAATSRNYSGANCSVRWFVPLLAPGYCVLSIVLARWPRFRVDFVLLSGWGAIMMAEALWGGPWTVHMVPKYWLIYGAALICWGGLALVRLKQMPVSRVSDEGGEFRAAVRTAAKLLLVNEPTARAPAGRDLPNEPGRNP